MPYPSTSSIMPRPDLAETLMEFDLFGNLNNMVAFEVAPIRDVPKFKGDFGRVPAKELMKRHPAANTKPPGFALERAPKSGYQQDDTKFDIDSWETTEFGMEAPVDDWEAEAYKDYFEQEAFCTSRIQARLLEEAELRVSSIVFDTTRFTVPNGKQLATTAGERWQDPVNARPLKHIQAGIFQVYNNSGMWPDSIVFNRFAWLYLIRTDEIREQVHAQGAGSPDRADLITKEIVGQALQLKNVIVAGGTYDKNNPSQTFAPGQIWGPHAMIFKRATSNDLRDICLARSFHCAEDNSMPRGYVESYEKPEIRGTQIRVRHRMQNRIMYDNVGCLLTDIYA